MCGELGEGQSRGVPTRRVSDVTGLTKHAEVSSTAGELCQRESSLSMLLTLSTYQRSVCTSALFREALNVGNIQEIL